MSILSVTTAPYAPVLPLTGSAAHTSDPNTAPDSTKVQPVGQGGASSSVTPSKTMVLVREAAAKPVEEEEAPPPSHQQSAENDRPEDRTAKDSRALDEAQALRLGIQSEQDPAPKGHDGYKTHDEGTRPALTVQAIKGAGDNPLDREGARSRY